MSKAFEIPSLNGIRTISFLIVFVAHAGLGDVVPGGFGVTIFFFLSGFLITTLLRLEWQKQGHINLWDFYLRRIFRILPPFYLVLLLSIASVFIFGDDTRSQALDSSALLAQALHITNYWTIYNGADGIIYGTMVYWSLAVEEHYYLVFPVLFMFVHSRVRTLRKQALVLAAICLAALVWRLVLVHILDASADRTYMGSDTRFDSILWGSVLALWGNPVIDQPDLTRTWTWFLFPLSIIALLCTFIYRDPEFRETWRYTIQGIALIPVFVVCINSRSSYLFRLLNSQPMQYLGIISYSMYLVHHVVLGIVEQEAGNQSILVAVIAFVVSLAISVAIYRFVEKPFAVLRKKLAHS